jgi:uncharacterized membrane protein
LPTRLHIATWLALTLVLGAASLNLAQADAGGVEGIEEVTEVTEVPAVKTPGQVASAFKVIGRIHSALVHVPIGWLTLLLLLDLATFLLKRADFERVGVYVLIGTVLSFFPAIAAGFLRMDELTGDVNVPALMTLHRNLILLMATLTAVALMLRLFKRNQLRGFWKVSYISLIFAAVLLISVAGHVGGKLVFGENFLPF